MYHEISTQSVAIVGISCFMIHHEIKKHTLKHDTDDTRSKIVYHESGDVKSNSLKKKLVFEKKVFFIPERCAKCKK